VLAQSEHRFGSILGQSRALRSTKLALMTAIADLRIRSVRFLVLYRWHLAQHSQSHNYSFTAGQSAAQQKVAAFFQVAPRSFYDQKFPPARPPGETADLRLHLTPPICPDQVARTLIADCSPDSGVHTAVLWNQVTVACPGEYAFTIRISRDGAASLSGFSVEWPSIVIFRGPAEIARLLRSRVRNSRKVLSDCKAILHWTYLKGLFLFLYEAVCRHQSAYTFDLVGLKIVFPTGIFFSISVGAAGLFLVGGSITFAPHAGKLRWPGVIESSIAEFARIPITNCRMDIRIILEQLRRLAHYTRLRQLWVGLVAGLKQVGTRLLSTIFTENAIDIYFLNVILCTFTLDAAGQRTTELNGCDPNSIVESDRACAEFIRALIAHGLVLFMASSSPDFHFCSDRTLDRGLVFSFAPDLPMSFSASLNGVSISIRGRRLPISAGSVTKAVFDARQTIILMCLASKLRGLSVPASLLDDQVRFLQEPFEGARFKLSTSGLWCFRFLRANLAPLRLVGRRTSARFVDWLLHVVTSASTFSAIHRQAETVQAMETVVRTVYHASETFFSIEFTHDFCTRLSVAFEGLSSGEGSVYDIAATPQVCFHFGRHVQLRRFLQHLLKNRMISSYFGPFLNTSFVPLHHLYGTFATGDWSVGSLRDDRSFFVIYQRIHSANFLLKPSQAFQMIVPSIGRSTLLQIPLEALGQFRHSAKLSHFTLKLHMSQLLRFRSVIEEFFRGRERLSELGFQNFILTDGNLACSLPWPLGGCRLHCFLRSRHFFFEVEGDGEVNRNLKNLLNFKFDSIETQIAVLRFVVALFDCENKFAAFVLQVTVALASKTGHFGIHWAESMKRSAVAVSEGKARLAFVTARHTTFAVEFARHQGDSVPEMIAIDTTGVPSRPRAMKDLTKWIEGLGL
jgi:hypothetical protein